MAYDPTAPSQEERSQLAALSSATLPLGRLRTDPTLRAVHRFRRAEVPYDPNALTAEGRSFQFTIMWLGLVTTIACLIQYFLFPDLLWLNIGYGIMMGALGNAVFSYGSDDYFRAQCYVGMSWSIAVLALYLLVLTILRVSDIAFVSGYRAVADGEVERIPMTAAGYANDASLLAMLLALAFYAGFAFAMLRDRFFMGGDKE
ncbi:hypothetical protein AAG593_08035 [Citromicrobium bathyomarinum]